MTYSCHIAVIRDVVIEGKVLFRFRAPLSIVNYAPYDDQNVGTRRFDFRKVTSASFLPV